MHKMRGNKPSDLRSFDDEWNLGLVFGRKKFSPTEECKMAEPVKIVTGIGNAELHRILVRGYDLNKELIGKIKVF